MNPWTIKITRVKQELDESQSRVLTTMTPDPLRLEIPGQGIEEAKKAAKALLESRGYRVRSLSVSATPGSTLLAYVHDGEPVHSVPGPGWRHRFPKKPPHP